MIGILAACKASDLCSRVALVGPSPRYINERDYVGGFTAAQIEELLEFWTAITWAGRRRRRH
jgi:sigma-B regulation protein RsbQ